MTIKPSITFVCCVESGALENYTVRMVESLRRWGGVFANSSIFAVTPRFGPPLSPKTHQAFEKFKVEHIFYCPRNPYSWNKFMNKPYALLAVEERSKSECIGWLDSDLIFLGEPSQLILNNREDFLACTPDSCGATTGLDDPLDPFWREVCQAISVNIEDLPWVITEVEGKRIRLYFNSGVFVYRRSTGFAKQYLQTCIRLMDTRLASQADEIFFHDQTLLGLTMFKMGLQWRSLPHSLNYGMGGKGLSKQISEEEIKAARIIHYHNAMWPEYWPKFMKCLQTTHPSVVDWLSSIGPMKNEAPFHWRTTGKVLQYFRSKKEDQYKRSCKVV